MFQLGEKVIYPQYGLGTISEVTEKQVNGKSLSFYRLEFPIKQMEILVPIQRAKDNGLRKVMGLEEVEAQGFAVGPSSSWPSTCNSIPPDLPDRIIKSSYNEMGTSANRTS